MFIYENGHEYVFDLTKGIGRYTLDEHVEMLGDHVIISKKDFHELTYTLILKLKSLEVRHSHGHLAMYEHLVGKFSMVAVVEPDSLSMIVGCEHITVFHFKYKYGRYNVSAFEDPNNPMNDFFDHIPETIGKGFREIVLMFDLVGEGLLPSGNH